MDVSIIYVNYKTNKVLINSILSVKKNTNKCNYEIIIVDNSNDVEIHNELESVISKLDNISIKLIDAKQNLGFGRANNVGTQYALGRYLLFLNTDTILYNDAISILKQFLDENPTVGIVGPNILDGEMKPAHSFYKYEKNLVNYRKINGFLCSLYKKIINKRNDYNYTTTPMVIHGYVCGACMMIRKSIFEKVGGFDKDIFMYAEETLLSYRVIHETGMKVFNVPSAKILHLEGTSFDDNSLHRIMMMVDGNWIYLKKALGVENAIKYAKKEIIYNKYKGTLYYILTRKKNNYFTCMSNTWMQKIKNLDI